MAKGAVLVFEQEPVAPGTEYNADLTCKHQQHGMQQWSWGTWPACRKVQQLERHFAA